LISKVTGNSPLAEQIGEKNSVSEQGYFLYFYVPLEQNMGRMQLFWINISSWTGRNRIFQPFFYPN